MQSLMHLIVSLSVVSLNGRAFYTATFVFGFIFFWESGGPYYLCTESVQQLMCASTCAGVGLVVSRNIGKDLISYVFQLSEGYDSRNF